MKEEITFRWRIKWQSRWITTRYHCTEEQIRKEHPEAICLEHTRTAMMVPSTAQETLDAMISNATSGFMKRR